MTMTDESIFQQLLNLALNFCFMLRRVVVRSGVDWNCIRMERYCMVIAACRMKLFGILENIGILSE